jgi:hypothetical protein
MPSDRLSQAVADEHERRALEQQRWAGLPVVETKVRLDFEQLESALEDLVGHWLTVNLRVSGGGGIAAQFSGWLNRVDVTEQRLLDDFPDKAPTLIGPTCFIVLRQERIAQDPRDWNEGHGGRLYGPLRSFRAAGELHYGSEPGPLAIDYGAVTALVVSDVTPNWSRYSEP